MECATCGLTPFDLPDGVDPDLVFERCEDREIRCQACATGRSFSVDFATPGVSAEGDGQR